ncbi:MAG: hypothetical protein GC205_08530 [Bacteroidetes bacterium]|nr:hypothetical protein [Bacteroidota bacterium]
MCTLLISYRQHAEFPLLIAANRDEFHDRPTRAMHWWPDQPHVLGGRDEVGGGTWFGITRQGRFAALTNFRQFPLNPDAPSRGDLVRGFLEGNQHPADFLQELQQSAPLFNGYNLLFGHVHDLWYFSNRSSQNGAVEPGMHGLSNALLNDPWPKVNEGRNRFQGLFQNAADLDAERVLEALANKTQFPDQLLPDTGVGLARERVLSALFIESPGYGTRASWFLRVRSDGWVDVTERSYLPAAHRAEVFELAPAASAPFPAPKNPVP